MHLIGVGLWRLQAGHGGFAGHRGHALDVADFYEWRVDAHLDDHNVIRDLDLRRRVHLTVHVDVDVDVECGGLHDHASRSA